METLAIEASVVISRKPRSRTSGSRTRFAFASSHPGDREAHVGRAAVAHVLDDHVDADAAVGERGEDGVGDAGAVGDLDEGDLGDVPVLGDAPHLVALLHERVLLDEGAGGVLERAEDLDDDVVHPAELDGADLHHLGALVGELQHLLVADDGELAGVGDEARVGRVDPLHVGVDLAAVGAERGGEGDGGRVGAAAAQRRGLRQLERLRALALEARDDDDLAVGHLGADPDGVDPGDARPAVGAVGDDAGLGAGQGDGGHARGRGGPWT